MNKQEEPISTHAVRKSSNFVETLATSVIVSFPNDGSVFILDFLKPVMDIVADEKGKIKGIHGELELNTRVILPPIVCKKLLNTLKDTIDKYESAFGEIKVREETKNT